jgi:hypothetical protein
VTTGGELAAARRALDVVAGRVAAIAEHACGGPCPVEPIEATLARIEEAIHQSAQSAYRAACRISELEDIAERIVTIADESFGIGPVEPVDVTLARIDAGVSSLRSAADRVPFLEAEVQRLLCWTVGEYVDGELDPAHAEAFRAHLVTCEPCQLEVRALAAVSARLSALELADG